MQVGLAIISHADCVLHNAGSQHPETPDRVVVIQKACQHYAFKVPTSYYDAPIVTREQLLLVHDSAYLDWLISVSPKDNLFAIDEDTYLNPYTLAAAYRAAGALVLAVDLVIGKKALAAFCNIRPPGHHAEPDKAMGFCFFNNVAVGAAYAMQQYGLTRIAIVDFDLHRGNGTQRIFQHDQRVLYCSSFADPLYPGYEDELDNEHILSVPLASRTKSALFREKVAKAWFEKLEAFKPQLLFFSAGFDAHHNDPLSTLDLHSEDYGWLTTQIANLTRKHTEGKIISVLEGGYNLDVLAKCVPMHVDALV